MAKSEPIHTLLATLGGQPQVVTFTLDLLLQRGIPIREVIVVYPASYSGLQDSIARLNAEFPSDCYRFGKKPIHFRLHVLTQYGSPIDDINNEHTADGALNAMDELIRDLKKMQRTIHFSITGGRRLIGFLSFSAALLNFDTSDRLWHIHTPETIKQQATNGTIMHATPEDGIRLIEVPFTRLAQPILSRLLSPDPGNARTVMDTQKTREQSEQHARCQQVVSQLTKTQLKVLHAIASGLHPQEVANLLDRNITTISSHTNTIFRECRNAWNMPEQARVDYRSLQILFKGYFPKDE